MTYREPAMASAYIYSMAFGAAEPCENRIEEYNNRIAGTRPLAALLDEEVVGCMLHGNKEMSYVQKYPDNSIDNLQKAHSTVHVMGACQVSSAAS